MNKSVVQRLFTAAIILFICIDAPGQGSGRPDSILRIDFEGRHRNTIHQSPGNEQYQPGNTIRLDFEGRHKNQAPPANSSIYQPGSTLRLDFEGKHKKVNTTSSGN